ncbi:hypothetical protein LR48_Vigan118s002100 [Vigna angularis]|nr:GRAS family protein RAD1 [Vigna angularis]KAG2396919.1 DELLA protein [Vigna angularis]KOM25571.1 hypothetical protein LR48_Vigan118s002100 [Vigna angularis]
MEDINRWLLSSYLNESVDHEFAIRRYCPARMEQEQGGECQDQEGVVFDDTELCYSDASTPCLASSEVDDFVDSFINMDQYEKADKGHQEKHQSFGHFVVMNNDEDEADADEYSSMNDVFGYLPATMEDSELEMYENLTMLEEEVAMSDSFGTLPEFVHCGKEANLGVEQGLELVHMLLACAEAVGCRDNHQTELLINRIWALASPSGDALQRVSYCFATGLKCRLSKSTFMDMPLINRENKLEAFQLLYQITPYITFGFMVANEAIFQASQGKSSIHIVDLGMQHTLQWSSLIRAFVSRPEGPPMVRITGLTDNEDNSKLQTSMNVLVQEASSLGMHLEFHTISEPASPSVFTVEKLNLRKGEVLFVNSILQLHKYVKESRGNLKEILLSVKKLGPTAFTVVEQDTNHNGPFFLGRFLESLHYYSAIFDSLEACMPRNSQQRMKIERLHFAEEILNIVAYEGPERIERHERVEQWRRQLGRAGFQVMPLKCTSQVRMMLSVYDCDGYTLSSEKGNLLLGWKGRPVIMSSAWQVASV